jgi:hypothetical protein
MKFKLEESKPPRTVDKLCSISLVATATAIANTPELNCGQGVLHGALQTFHYDLIDIHKLTPKIQEVIAFTK